MGSGSGCEQKQGDRLLRQEGPKAENGLPLKDVAACIGRFQKKYRLTSPSEYRNVFNTKTRSVDSRFVVLAKENSLEYPRLGLAVSRKKIPGAVCRNRVKRIIRESFRKNRKLLQNLDLVVMPQKNINQIKNEILRKSLETHWRNLSRCKSS